MRKQNKKSASGPNKKKDAKSRYEPPRLIREGNLRIISSMANV